MAQQDNLTDALRKFEKPTKTTGTAAPTNATTKHSFANLTAECSLKAERYLKEYC